MVIVSGFIDKDTSKHSIRAIVVLLPHLLALTERLRYLNTCCSGLVGYLKWIPRNSMVPSTSLNRSPSCDDESIGGTTVLDQIMPWALPQLASLCPYLERMKIHFLVLVSDCLVYRRFTLVSRLKVVDSWSRCFLWLCFCSCHLSWWQFLTSLLGFKACWRGSLLSLFQLWLLSIFLPYSQRHEWWYMMVA